MGLPGAALNTQMLVIKSLTYDFPKLVNTTITKYNHMTYLLQVICSSAWVHISMAEDLEKSAWQKKSKSLMGPKCPCSSFQPVLCDIQLTEMIDSNG